MDPDVTIRNARPEDAIAITRLAVQLGYPVDAAAVATRLAAILAADQDDAILVLTRADTVAGWLHVFHARRLEVAPFAEIAALVVDADCRNQRLGERLVDAAVAWAQARGLASIRVRSNVIRADAHRFYQRVGFAQEKSQAVLCRPLG